MNEILLYFSIKYEGNWSKINDALEKFEKVSESKLNLVKKYKNLNYLTIIDKKYPKIFRNSIKPPFVIFYKGNLNLLKKRNLKKIIWPFVSWEKTSKIKKEDWNEFLIKKIKYVIGSGHKFETKFLKKVDIKKIIVVKDSGINSNIGFEKKVEEKILRNSGLIISEYPNDVISSPKNWIDSGRIKATITNKMLILNSEKNRTLFELLFFVINQNKGVICLKNSNIESYNNFLIKNGAYGINNIKEIKNLW